MKIKNRVHSLFPKKQQHTGCKSCIRNPYKKSVIFYFENKYNNTMK